MRRDKSTNQDPVWLIEPQLWSNWDAEAAAQEGWLIAVSDTPGASCIQRLTRDHLNALGIGVVRPFKSDLQASKYVLERMHQGSTFHESAWRALMKAQIHGAKP